MHSNESDYTCPRCHVTVRAGIPHECNYMVCHACNGLGMVGWRHAEVCESCGGTGKWTNKPEEENKEGALV